MKKLIKNLKTYSTKELAQMQTSLLDENDFRSKRNLIDVNRELRYRMRKACKHNWGHFSTTMGKTRQTPRQEHKCNICGVHGFMQYSEVCHPVGIRAKYIR